ncbi:helix-turn-helix domain-containing protein [Rathayibacter sp. AY1B8]|uniref:TetR/AcrR family transcriptional regulator n=1 Tax=Rathayibacter sp. AY1B8 TaxID=2080533 RepID=UPI0015E353FE
MTGAKNRSTPVKPLQDRAHRTRAAIVAAAREVVIEVGRDRATTAKVAARASVGIGTLYRYFVDFAVCSRPFMQRIRSTIDIKRY